MTNILYVIWSLGLGGAEQVVISLSKDCGFREQLDYLTKTERIPNW
jgi:hypothetical protein